MTLSKVKEYTAAILGVSALVGIDRWTKYLAARDLKGQSDHVLIDGVLGLSYYENTGAAFGMFKDGRIFFLILTAAALAALVYFYIHLPSDKRYLPLKVLFVFISGGAIGNLIDRIAFGYVVDFIELTFIHFPVFNIADIFVSWSCVIIMLLVIFKYRNEDLKELFKHG